jgi:hypothetical protein
MGDGAFSNVYKAVDLKTGLKVAVKVVRKYELNTSQVRTSFILNFSDSSCRSTFPIILSCLPCAGHTWDQDDDGLVPFFLLIVLYCSNRNTSTRPIASGSVEVVGKRHILTSQNGHHHLSKDFKKRPRVTEVCFSLLLPQLLFSFIFHLALQSLALERRELLFAIYPRLLVFNRGFLDPYV